MSCAWCADDVIMPQANIRLKQTAAGSSSNESSLCWGTLPACHGCKADQTRWCWNVLTGEYSRPVGMCRLGYSMHQSHPVSPSFPLKLPRGYTPVVCVLLCVQLFKGKFFHCEGLHVSNITNKTQCLEAGYRWARRKYNFDNLGQVCLRYAHVCVATLVRSPESLS